MKTTFSSLTQSQFFTQAFNSAIFDGPIRIYFSQFHESYALKIYFTLQEKLSASWPKAREFAKDQDVSVLIMIYPTEESFRVAFPPGPFIENEPLISESDLLGEPIIGISTPFDESSLGIVSDKVQIIFDNWMNNAGQINRIEKTQEIPAQSLDIA